jgi:hypothetical protein
MAQQTPGEVYLDIHEQVFHMPLDRTMGGILDELLKRVFSSVDIREVNDMGLVQVKGEASDGDIRITTSNNRLTVEVRTLGVWVSNNILNFDDVQSLLVVEGFSTALAQEPIGTDNALQIEFGPDINTSQDAVNILANGEIHINESAVYILNVFAHFGRLGAGGESELRLRALIDGIQVGETIGAKIDSSKAIDHIGRSITAIFLAGSVLTFEVYRDSAGHDSGGLYSQEVNAAGWEPCPSAGVSLRRLLRSV